MMPRPNILMIMPDQQRADCIGAFGNQSILTPNIDALALKGMKFTNAYVNHPVCSPSRVNFMTGWYPHTRGHRTLTHLIQPHEPNLLRYLKDGGYHVAWAGARGDVFAPGVTEASTHFSGFTTPPKKMGMGPQHPIGSPLYDAFYHGLRPGEETWLDFDEACTRTAIDWLAQKPKGPWCLWAPLIFPHLPFEVEQQWYDLYSPEDLPKRISSPGSGKPQFHQAIREKLGTDRLTEDHWQEIRRVYYAMISRVDHQLGRILDALELTGEADNTFVLYFTDHGEYAGDFGLVEKWPSGLDRSLLQNPLIIAGPGVKPNTTAATFTEMVDLMPTLLDLADIKVTHTHFGRSLVDVLSDPEAKIRDAAFSEGGFVTDELNLLEVAKGEYANKANLQHEQPSLVGRAIAMRTELYTYIYRLYESDELYDRSDDPNETENLIDHPEHKGRINDMKSKVLDWLFSSADVIPWTADPRFPKISHGGHDIFSNQG
ncbi:MAG: sulfatase-like hydrolase/transferase [Pseudomonadales bacterium]